MRHACEHYQYLLEYTATADTLIEPYVPISSPAADLPPH